MANLVTVRVVCLLILSVSCRSSTGDEFATSPQVQLDLPGIRERGFLNALVDNNSISYFIYRGEPLGYEYELLTRFTEYLNVELRIRIISGVEEAIDLLNKGEGDIIAFPLTITAERTNYVSFSDPHFNTRQVLVQLKPEGWREEPDLVDKSLVRDVTELIGKEVFVMKESSFKERLETLSLEIGGEIIIREDSADAETESLIRKVARGEIMYTVTDEPIAMVNATYYPDLDISTVISLPQQIAWAVRLNSPDLRDSINAWLTQVKRKGTYKILFDKYFNSPRTSRIRMSSDFSSLRGGKLSIYDEHIQEEAKLIGWDWRLLASIIFQESTFNPKVVSWAGAVGLMQVMPGTGKQFDVDNLLDPRQNIRAGVRFLKHLDGLWARTVEDPDERMKFVLASYNAGLSHMIDARDLAKKYGRNPVRWDDNVEYFLMQKSKPQFYRDPVAAAGYCRCEGVLDYVKEVLRRYEEYKLHIQ